MSQTSVSEKLRAAITHHQAGQLQAAEALYRQVLAAEPRHAEALHLLGTIAIQVGKYDVAVQLIEQAVALEPRFADAYCNLGSAYEKLEQAEKAAACYQRALEIVPGLPEAHYNLANILWARGQMDEAMAGYRQALALRPGYIEALYNYANALVVLGQHAAAIETYQQAIALDPENPHIHRNLGYALSEVGRFDDAIASYKRAILLFPNFAEDHYNLGNAYQRSGKIDEAIASFSRAIVLKPNYPEASNHLGNALQAAGNFDQALGAYRRALELKPDFAEALSNMGNALHERGRLGEAVEAHQRALALKSDFRMARSNLGMTYLSRGQIGEAISTLRKLAEDAPDFAQGQSNLLLALQYDPKIGAGELLAEHQRWAALHAERFMRGVEPHRNERSPERRGGRLRVGYVSGDFREHSIAFFLEPLLAAHDREKFEIFCYSSAWSADAYTARFRKLADQWREVAALTDAQLAAQIRADAIDVLVDLSLFTSGGRIFTFARKPAPVQINYLGYCSTSGLPQMDYRITDALVDPPGVSEAVNSEQLVRPAECFCCYRPPDEGPDVGELPAGSAGAITFGSFNTLAKLNDDVMDVWSEILRRTENSRLMLKARGLGDPPTRELVLERSARRGIGAERLVLAPHGSLREYLEQLGQIDIALDPFPFNGHTTMCHSLWMGAPVIVLAGERSVARVGVSVLTNLGLEELVASSRDDYVTIAAGLAGDLPRLKMLRSGMRQRMSEATLLDSVNFTRKLEAAYRQAWVKWCAGGSS